ncbi:MAG: hypothetical protein K0U74_09650 [Alphaproteobacteria bacterium]|nr:hypothetical protein [Alphaproteobacteria bacterium]
MTKDFVIWLYNRSASMLVGLGAMSLVWLAAYLAVPVIDLMQNGQKATGRVVELVARPGEELAAGAVEDAQRAGGGPGIAVSEPGAELDATEGFGQAAESEAGADADDGKAAVGEQTAETEPACIPVAPRVEFPARNGQLREFMSTSFSCPSAFKVGGPAHVLFDARDPENVLVSATGEDWWEHFILPAALCVAAAILGFVAWFIRPSSQDLMRLQVDPALEDEKVLPLAVSDQRELPGPGGLVDSARFIEQGKYPLELCEFAAYMAALSYHEPSKDQPLTLEQYLEKNCPQHRYVQQFANEDTEGFGFVYGGAAFIVMRGTKGWGDWARNLKAGRTGPNEFLPNEPNWQNPPKSPKWEAPARHWGFAQGWDVIRDQVEAWIATTPLKDQQRFIFVGHSLGGALSFLGAWEFATRGRKVAGVLTFGAAIPGKAEFKREYEALGLDKRTLRLEFTRDVVPEIQQLIGYEKVGQVWEPERLPLLSQRLALAAIPVNWLVGHLQAKLLPAAKPEDEEAQSLHDKNFDENWMNENEERREAVQAKPTSTEPENSAREKIRTWLLRLVIFLAFSSILALAAHKMERRYALALSVMSYRRIRARHLAAVGDSASADFEACYRELGEHLRKLRGSTPEAPVLFSSVANLPRKVECAQDLKWLNTFHSARSW